ncbi:type II secretion system minor pseudopilin GspI [Methylovulum miyakonense]|uniref:type II secretion system minor pseudopilin GspI n=1 Tax=Methylovulum miyakonense TaxID=645578 RepID=UPI000376F003|nr:type II secretion system minor pseudopilin GspI [Methylovulum miyakonense]
MIARNSKGFTLLEILIALAVLAIVMISLIKITSDNSRNLWHVENKTLAGIIASNHITQLRLSTELPEQQDGWETMARRKWYWQVQRPVTSNALGLWQYTVNVFLEGDKDPYITMTSLIAKPVKPKTE